MLAHAAGLQLAVSFFNIAEHELPLFRRFGFQATKWGEEALIELHGCAWTGRAYRWVRRQSSFCRRHGLVVSECVRESMPAGQWDRVMREICEISRLFLADKPQRGELQWLEGRFDPEHLGRKRDPSSPRARRGAGRIEGFLACDPVPARRPLVDGNLSATPRRRPRDHPLPLARGHADVPGRGRAAGLAMSGAGAAMSDADAGRQPVGPLGPGPGHAALRPDFRYGRGVSLQDAVSPLRSRTDISASIPG